MARKYYVTTAIPYVNAAPHIGHALEFLQGDATARYHKLLGDDVHFISGGDENALKNVQAAEKADVAIQDFVNCNTALFVKLAKELNVSFDTFLQSSNTKIHYPASQKLWELCKNDIYQKEYKGLYCVGCETFYEREELDEEGECFEHPGKQLEEVSETNYFFKLSKYQHQIEELIGSDALKIHPQSRKNEVLSFVKQGLTDISISRSNKRARDWGVPVPGDDSQRMYVWFDALNVYQSAIGFGTDDPVYKKWWPADVHIIGKGIIRFHAVYWPAFLMSAGLQVPKELFVHGYITVEGQKMSKTVGNVVDPFELISEFGVDPVRYYLLREIPSYGDGDFSKRRFREVYNGDLANGLGNLVARVAKLSEKAQLRVTSYELRVNDKKYDAFNQNLKEYKFNDALQFVWGLISEADVLVNQKKPWGLEGEQLEEIMADLGRRILEIAWILTPFLPDTSEKIIQQFSGKVTSQKPLFPRIS